MPKPDGRAKRLHAGDAVVALSRKTAEKLRVSLPRRTDRSRCKSRRPRPFTHQNADALTIVVRLRHPGRQRPNRPRLSLASRENPRKRLK